MNFKIPDWVFMTLIVVGAITAIILGLGAVLAFVGAIYGTIAAGAYYAFVSLATLLGVWH